MSSEFKCEHCGACLSSKGNLNTHINYSKRCIQKRNTIQLKCEGDNCLFTSNNQKILSKHQYQCNLYIKSKEAENIVLKNKSEMLETMLKEERSKPTKSTVNNVNNKTFSEDNSYILVIISGNYNDRGII